MTLCETGPGPTEGDYTHPSAVHRRRGRGGRTLLPVAGRSIMMPVAEETFLTPQREGVEAWA